MRFKDEHKIALISSLIYSIALLVHFLVITYGYLDYSYSIADQSKFIIRGQGWLNFKLPYLSFNNHAATLSGLVWAFLLVLGELFGLFNFSFVFSYTTRVFFSFCLILSALLLYRIKKAHHKRKAYLISLFYAINPFSLWLVTFWGSDECMIVFFILVVLYLFEKNHNGWAVFFMVLFTSIKFWTIFMGPLIWIYPTNKREIILHTLQYFIVLFTIELPFYIIAPQEYLYFKKYPIEEQGNQGLLTLIDQKTIVNVPDTFLFYILTVIGVGLAGFYLFQNRSKWKLEYTGMIFSVYLLLYPKYQLSYIILLYPFLFSAFFLQQGIIKKCYYFLFYFFSITAGTAAKYLISDTSHLVFAIIMWITVFLFYLLLIIFPLQYVIDILQYQTSNVNTKKE